jgi:integral membrane sensor domain MASE1
MGEPMSRVTEKSKLLSKRADNLDGAGAAVLWLGLIGAAVLLIVGFIPACPPGDFNCYESDKMPSWGLIAIALATALTAWWLYALSSVIASRAALAVEVAHPTPTSSMPTFAVSTDPEDKW